MDATISLHSFGRKSSWFSRAVRRPSVGSFRLIVLLLGVLVFGMFGGLFLASLSSLQALAASLDGLDDTASFIQQALDAREQIEVYLVSGDNNAYTSGSHALTLAVAAIAQAEQTAASSTLDTFALRRLETTGGDYLHLIHSLDVLITGNADPAAQQVIRQRINATALAFDQTAYTALRNGIAAANSLLEQQTSGLVNLTLMLLVALIAIFGSAFVLVRLITRHSAYALQQIGLAARAITRGDYDTRIDLDAEMNPDIAQLAAAFNRMAENLKLALASESAATRQNGMQLLKLARQERMTAVLEERQRIARELHDSVKQQLFSITLSAGAAINLLNSAPDLVRLQLEHIRQAGHTAQAEMTALLQELIPVSLQEKRLEDALLGYLTPLCGTHQIKLLWCVNGTNTLTIAEEHALLRAVQEAVANVVRHSHATLLRVSLSFGLVTHVIIEDNGEGFIPEAVPETSTGLALMKLRLKRVGGHCAVESERGTGTRLTIQLDSRRAASAQRASAGAHI